MNRLSNITLNKLLNKFQSDYSPLSLQDNWQGNCPIGIEIEIKWRYYFPELYDKYLKNNSYDSLSDVDKINLTKECDFLEEVLLPKLKLTEECGIEKGQDKYYEFAFTPVKNVFLVYDQISLLKKENLIPDGKHSIHFTIGGLRNNSDTYYLLLLLEMIMSSKERLRSGFHNSNPKLSSTWAKKGMGGIFLKEGKELKHNYSEAIELRTLFIEKNNNNSNFNIHSLKLLSTLSDIIYSKQQNIINNNINIWNQFLIEVKKILLKYNLKNENWKKPNLNKETWLYYIDNYDDIQKEMLPIIKSLANHLNLKV